MLASGRRKFASTISRKGILVLPRSGLRGLPLSVNGSTGIAKPGEEPRSLRPRPRSAGPAYYKPGGRFCAVLGAHPSLQTCFGLALSDRAGKRGRTGGRERRMLTLIT